MDLLLANEAIGY